MGPFSGAKIRGMLLDGDLFITDQISVDKKTWAAIETVPAVMPLQLRAEAGDKVAQAKLAAREKSRERESAEERRFPLVAVTVLTVIVAGVVGFSVWLGMPEGVDTPTCDAAPAPGVNWRNCLLPGVDVGPASLAGANLNSAVLRGGNFSATDLRDADIRYADLSRANLRYAQLSGARLVGANLQGADIRGSDLSHTDLRFADLSGSLTEGAVFDGASLHGAIWTDGKTCSDQSVGRCLPDSP